MTFNVKESKGGMNMKCPYCEEIMVAGFVQSARQVYFTTDKKRFLFSAAEGDIVLGDAFLDGATFEAYHCPKCRKVVIDCTEK